MKNVKSRSSSYCWSPSEILAEISYTLVRDCIASFCLQGLCTNKQNGKHFEVLNEIISWNINGSETVHPIEDKPKCSAAEV